MKKTLLTISFFIISAGLPVAFASASSISVSLNPVTDLNAATVSFNSSENDAVNNIYIYNASGGASLGNERDCSLDIVDMSNASSGIPLLSICGVSSTIPNGDYVIVNQPKNSFKADPGSGRNEWCIVSAANCLANETSAVENTFTIDVASSTPPATSTPAVLGGIGFSIPTSTAPTFLAQIGATLGEKPVMAIIAIPAGLFLLFYVLKQLLDLMYFRSKK